MTGAIIAGAFATHFDPVSEAPIPLRVIPL